MTFDILAAILILGLFVGAIVVVFRETEWSFKVFLWLLAADLILALVTLLHAVVRMLAGSINSSSEWIALGIASFVALAVLFYGAFGIRQGRSRRSTDTGKAAGQLSRQGH